MPVTYRLLSRGIPDAKHAFEGMLKTAPDAAAKAKPILKRIIHDVMDIPSAVGLAPSASVQRESTAAAIRG